MATGDKMSLGPEGVEAQRMVLSAVREALPKQGSPGGGTVPHGEPAAGETWLLAVSGGIDSMVLLDAVSSITAVPLTAPTERAPTVLVATFDHGTGPAATAAARLVAETAATLDVPCVVGTAAHPGRTEAEWRHARWTFLRGLAQQHNARIVTAHTETDQIETVFMRALRDAGPRGLAALYAESDILRPLLTISRSQIVAYAESRDITYITDPSNFNTQHLRNRVRNEILPRIRSIRPEFESELLTLAVRAADWRAQMDRIAANFTVMIDGTDSVYVPRAQFAGYSEAALRVLWPALAARARIVMDWRGTHRLATFTIEGDPGQSIQLSGGIHVRLRRDALVFRRDGSRE